MHAEPTHQGSTSASKDSPRSESEGSGKQKLRQLEKEASTSRGLNPVASPPPLPPPSSRAQRLQSWQRMHQQMTARAEAVPSPSPSPASNSIVQRLYERRVDAQPAQDPVQIARSGISDSGEPLPQLATFQRAFAPMDLSGVRVHRGPLAQTAARSLSAKAFTHGEHIALSGPASLRTLAHEAAHVVQQRAGGVPAGLSEPGDPGERAADTVADRVCAGESAADLLGGAAGASAGASTTAAETTVQRETEEGLKDNKKEEDEEKKKVNAEEEKEKVKAENQEITVHKEELNNADGDVDGLDADGLDVDGLDVDGLDVDSGIPGNLNDLHIIEASHQGTETPKGYTISRALDVVHWAYTTTELAAYQSEGLWHAFADDLGYVNRRCLRLQPQPEPQPVQANDAQPIQVGAQQNSEDDLSWNERQHRKKYDKEYDLIIKFDKAEDELSEAKKFTLLAEQTMKINYFRRMRIGILYNELKEIRKKHNSRSVWIAGDRVRDKRKAKENAYVIAQNAIDLAVQATDAYKFIEKQKFKLCDTGRMAPTITYQTVDWLKKKAPNLAKKHAMDTVVGFGTLGLAKVEGHSDARGFPMPLEYVKLNEVLADAFRKIVDQHERIRKLTGNEPSILFQMNDSVILILELLSRTVLDGLKRIIRFVKYWLTLFSAIPGLAAITGPLAALGSMLSAGMSVVQFLANALVVSLRAAQLWQSSPFVHNILAASLTDAAIEGFFASTKVVVGAWSGDEADSPGKYMGDLRNDATFGYGANLWNPEKGPSKLGQGGGPSELTVEQAKKHGPGLGVSLAKGYAKNAAKSELDYYKTEVRQQDGKISGGTTFDANSDEMDGKLFMAAMSDVLSDAAVFDSKSQRVVDQTGKENATLIQGTEQAKEVSLQLAEDETEQQRPPSTPKDANEPKLELQQSTSHLGPEADKEAEEEPAKGQGEAVAGAQTTGQLIRLSLSALQAAISSLERSP